MIDELLILFGNDDLIFETVEYIFLVSKHPFPFHQHRNALDKILTFSLSLIPFAECILVVECFGNEPDVLYVFSHANQLTKNCIRFLFSNNLINFLFQLLRIKIFYLERMTIK